MVPFGLISAFNIRGVHHRPVLALQSFQISEEHSQSFLA